MKIIQQRKRKLANKYNRLKAGWNKVWGFYEDEGVSFPLGGGHFGLHARGEASPDNFWKHLCQIVDRIDVLRNKVQELTSRKAFSYKTRNLSEADALKVVQALNQKLPQKWAKYCSYYVKETLDSEFNVCFGASGGKRPHSLKNLMAAYKEVYLDAKFMERGIIGKFQ